MPEELQKNHDINCLGLQTNNTRSGSDSQRSEPEFSLSPKAHKRHSDYLEQEVQS